MGLIVQKFGGTSVKDRDRIFNVARIVANTRNQGNDVVVVVSAQGDTTDDLITKAAEITSDPSHREMDMLLATGEQISISLLAMALQEIGVPSVSLTGWQAGFNTDRAYTKARIKRLNTERVESELARNRVVVVAGFQGLNRSDDITTLGRGGSDTTAVALAAKLGWECHIYTDVNGVYTIDPRLYRHARLLKEITYNEMMQMACLGAGVLETRSVELASKYNVPLFLGRALEKDKSRGTWIMEQTRHLEEMPITGISIKEDYAIMRVNDLPTDGVFIGKLFQLIAEMNINLDTISQQLSEEGRVNFSFYCSEEQSDQILENTDRLGSEYPIHRMLGFIKLSVIGVGISTHSGIASKVLNTLNANGIRYYMITSSEISISLTIEKKDKEKAVEVLGKAFDL